MQAWSTTSGAPVATLAPDDLKVAENGVEGKIVKVEPIDWPVKVQLLIDNGTGMDDGPRADSERRQGLRRGAARTASRCRCYTTAPQPRSSCEPTTDKQAMLQGVDRIAPDSGAARFVEGLNEAAARIDKEKGNYFPVVVIVGSTTAEGSSVVERDVQRMLQRFVDRAATVHVVMLTTGAQSGVRRESDGRWRRGRQEHGRPLRQHRGGHPAGHAAARDRRADRQEPRASKPQFRITFQRPNGASGPLGAGRRGDPGRADADAHDQRTAAVTYNPSDS